MRPPHRGLVTSQTRVIPGDHKLRRSAGMPEPLTGAREDISREQQQTHARRSEVGGEQLARPRLP